MDFPRSIPSRRLQLEGIQAGLPTSVLCEACFKQGMVIKSMKSLLTAKVSITEESREGKLHAGICAGGVG